MHFLRTYLPSLLILFSLPGFSQTEAPEVERSVTELVRTGKVTGLAGAYFKNGRINTFTAGSTAANRQQPVTDSTVFSAASLSKPVLAYLVWQLVDEGILDLDLPVSEYYSYPDVVAGPRADSVTIRQLLTHHGGLPNWRDGDTLTFKQDPGHRFSYSGEGYVWLSHMLEHLTGTDYATLARKRVFEPLGMHRSSLIFEDRFADDFAVPHEEGTPSETEHKWSSVNAAASLQTTAGDYARFLIALLRQTKFLNQRITVDYSIWNDSPTPAPNTVGWVPGLGFQRVGEEYQYWHWGHNTGFRTYFTVLPSEGRGLVFFTNDSNGLDLAPALTELFGLGDQPGWRWAGYE